MVKQCSASNCTQDQVLRGYCLKHQSIASQPGSPKNKKHQQQHKESQQQHNTNSSPWSSSASNGGPRPPNTPVPSQQRDNNNNSSSSATNTPSAAFIAALTQAQQQQQSNATASSSSSNTAANTPTPQPQQQPQHFWQAPSVPVKSTQRHASIAHPNAATTNAASSEQQQQVNSTSTNDVASNNASFVTPNASPAKNTLQQQSASSQRRTPSYEQRNAYEPSQSQQQPHPLSQSADSPFSHAAMQFQQQQKHQIEGVVASRSNSGQNTPNPPQQQQSQQPAYLQTLTASQLFAAASSPQQPQQSQQQQPSASASSHSSGPSSSRRPPPRPNDTQRSSLNAALSNAAAAAANANVNASPQAQLQQQQQQNSNNNRRSNSPKDVESAAAAASQQQQQQKNGGVNSASSGSIGGIVPSVDTLSHSRHNSMLRQQIDADLAQVLAATLPQSQMQIQMQAQQQQQQQQQSQQQSQSQQYQPSYGIPLPLPSSSQHPTMQQTYQQTMQPQSQSQAQSQSSYPLPQQHQPPSYHQTMHQTMQQYPIIVPQQQQQQSNSHATMKRHMTFNNPPSNSNGQAVNASQQQQQQQQNPSSQSTTKRQISTPAMSQFTFQPPNLVSMSSSSSLNANNHNSNNNNASPSSSSSADSRRQSMHQQAVLTRSASNAAATNNSNGASASSGGGGGGGAMSNGFSSVAHCLDSILAQSQCGEQSIKRCAGVLRKLAAAQEDYGRAILRIVEKDNSTSNKEALHAAQQQHDASVDSMQSTRDAQMELLAVISSLGQLQLQYAQRLSSTVVAPLTETHIQAMQRRTELEKERKKLSQELQHAQQLVVKTQHDAQSIVSLQQQQQLSAQQAAQDAASSSQSKSLLNKLADRVTQGQIVSNDKVQHTIAKYNAALERYNALGAAHQSQDCPRLASELEQLERRRCTVTSTAMLAMASWQHEAAMDSVRLASRLPAAQQTIDADGDIRFCVEQWVAKHGAQPQFRMMQNSLQGGEGSLALMPGGGSSSSRTPQPSQHSLFGATLDRCLSLTLITNQLAVVPLIVSQCCSYLLDPMNQALALEGIFRISPDKTALDALKRRIDDATFNSNARDYALHTCDPHLVAALLKDWLRSLYTPLLNESAYAAALDLAHQPQCTPYDVQSRVCACMDPTSQSVLHHILRVVHEALQPHNAKTNRMSVDAFSVVLSPALLRCSSSDPMMQMANIKFETKAVGSLIQHLVGWQP